MKVKEIRDILKGYTEKEKDNIIIELYNRFPKKMIKEKEIDFYLKNANIKKEKLVPSLDEDMIDEIETFISEVKEGLYARPNRIISKEERSKWRYKVKKYYKVLTSTEVYSEEGIIATEYLEILFNLLSYGTEYLLFTTWETFSSIGVSQLDYLNMLYERLLSINKEENLIKCAKLSLIIPDKNTLTTDGIRLLCYQTCKEDKLKLIYILKHELEELSKIKDYNNYRLSCYYEGILYLFFTCNLIEEGIKFYLNNTNKDLDNKVTNILYILDELEYDEEWIELYEKYKKELSSRPYIIEKYKEKTTK